MKKFLILSYSISGMGGGQMYQYNKLKFMKAHGYETYLFYAVPGKIIIKEIEDVAQIGCLNLINTDPRILSQKEIQKKLSEMSFILGYESTELIIECCNKTTSLWGELLAEKLHGFSYSLILDEKIGSMDNQLKAFFGYKREKNELKGVKNETYEMIFGGQAVPINYQYCLPIAGNNVVSDVMFDDIIDKNIVYDLKICSIGRLDKDYVQTLVEQILRYAQNNNNMRICMSLLGSSPKCRVEKAIKEKVKDRPNLDVYFWGAMFPIPEKLLYEFDVFISSAGSARVSGDRGIPTITVDARDHMAIGVYEYETDNTVFRKNEPKIPIAEKLSYVVDNYDKIKKELYVKSALNFDEVFGKHLEYYKTHINTKEYYDVLSMKLSKEKIVEKVIYAIFGKKIYECIRKIAFSKLQR
ncbi:MAG: hypothetical protein KH034_08025 [Lachnospiraceae bacterium]|nr:hypothetical protein [Lachnospiraceae bacterium]